MKLKQRDLRNVKDRIYKPSCQLYSRGNSQINAEVYDQAWIQVSLRVQFQVNEQVMWKVKHQLYEA